MESVPDRVTTLERELAMVRERQEASARYFRNMQRVVGVIVLFVGVRMAWLLLQ